MADNNAMDTAQQPTNPPSLANTSPHSTGSNASGQGTSAQALQQQQQQQQQLLQQQQPPQQVAQQPNAQQQASINDFLRRFRAEAQTLGILLPSTQQLFTLPPPSAAGGASNTAGTGGTGGATGANGGASASVPDTGGDTSAPTRSKPDRVAANQIESQQTRSNRSKPDLARSH